jgi:hypothetical protein
VSGHIATYIVKSTRLIPLAALASTPIPCAISVGLYIILGVAAALQAGALLHRGTANRKARMEVDFAFLCDHAEAGQKLHAMGIGIDTLYVADLPGVHPGIFAVIQLRFRSTEIGAKSLAVHIREPDGQDVARIDAKIEVREPPGGAADIVSRLVIGIKPLPLPKYGPYSVRWVVHETEMKDIPFRVETPPETT